jgi:hypothetical protein
MLSCIGCCSRLLGAAATGSKVCAGVVGWLMHTLFVRLAYLNRAISALLSSTGVGWDSHVHYQSMGLHPQQLPQTPEQLVLACSHVL